MELSDCGDADTVSVKPVMQQAMTGWHARKGLPSPADELVVALRFTMSMSRSQCLTHT